MSQRAQDFSFFDTHRRAHTHFPFSSPVFEAMALADGVVAAAAPVAAGTLVAGLAEEDVATPTTAAALCVGARPVVTEPTPPTPPLGCTARASVTGVPAAAATATAVEVEATAGEADTAANADGTTWVVAAPGVVAAVAAVAVIAALGCRM